MKNTEQIQKWAEKAGLKWVEVSNFGKGHGFDVWAYDPDATTVHLHKGLWRLVGSYPALYIAKSFLKKDAARLIAECPSVTSEHATCLDFAANIITHAENCGIASAHVFHKEHGCELWANLGDESKQVTKWDFWYQVQGGTINYRIETFLRDNPDYGVNPPKLEVFTPTAADIEEAFKTLEPAPVMTLEQYAASQMDRALWAMNPAPVMTHSQHPVKPHGKLGFYTKRAYGCASYHHTRPAQIHSDLDVLESRPFTTMEHARQQHMETQEFTAALMRACIAEIKKEQETEEIEAVLFEHAPEPKPVHTESVIIPACKEHNGVFSTKVTLNWYCPTCGGERGVIETGISWDGSRRLGVNIWTNPCGHIDSYEAVRGEALNNGLNPHLNPAPKKPAVPHISDLDMFKNETQQRNPFPFSRNG